MNSIYKTHTITVILLGLILSLTSCTNSMNDQSQDQSGSDKKAKYIFLFIGDGMGITQYGLTEAVLSMDPYQKDEVIKDEVNPFLGKMNMQDFPVTGLSRTSALDRYITGSAAAGTALASGYKTSIGTIGMNADHTQKYTTIAELAKQKGMKVGIVSSVSIDHATPASFYAHTNSRDNYYEIGQQLPKSGFDYFAGGGVRWNKYDDAGLEENIQYFLDSIAAYGYTYVDDAASFEALKAGDEKIIATLKKFREDPSDGFALPYIQDLDEFESEDDRITLSDFTKKGIELLDNEAGFFMMVEGGKIDWASHANDAASVIYNTIEFDEAIGEAIEFYKKYPDETIIIVTADHECGGLTLGYGGTKYDTQLELLAHQNVSYVSFTNEVQQWAKEGNITFESAMERVKEAYGLGDTSRHEALELSENELSQLKEAFKASMEGGEAKSKEDKMRYGGEDPFTITVTHILNHKAGIEWSSFSHTATPVPVFALGVGAEHFTGLYDNTDIPKRLMKLAGIQE